MMSLLKKTITFEAAHRLAKNYEGKCANIHGHSWGVELGIEYSGLDSYDMGVDYADMKTFLKEIEDEFDHTLILWMGDKEFVTALDGKTKLRLVEHNPTSEIIAQLIFNRAFNHFRNFEKLKVAYVEVKETCTSACRVTDNKLWLV